MSNKEWDKARLIQRVLDRRLSQVEAAGILGISTRQVRRLCRRVEERGVASLGHGLRGRPSNRRSMAGDRDRILAVVRERYADFGPTLAQEKLAELHGLHVSVETLRQFMQSLTLRYNRVLDVLEDTPDTRRARGHRVDVLEEDNGTVTLWQNGRHLPAKAWPKDGRSHQGEVVPNKRLGAALAWAQAHQTAREQASTRRKTTREQQLLADGTRRRPGKCRRLTKAG